MKKLFFRTGLAAGTLGIVVAGAAAFSAFEAHVVNVTATIENATNISTTALTYGTVFPEEWLHQFVTLDLSSSFLAEDNVTGLDYHIRQKPKCSDGEGHYEAVVDVLNQDGKPVSFACPDNGFTMLPLLCPFLSKHPVSTQTDPIQNDGSLDSFHGPTSTPDWTPAVAASLQVEGHLVKQTDPSDTWDIDLHVPCFAGQCAQDNMVPPAYQIDPHLNHAQFGCDLWYEVSGVNRPTTTPQLPL